MTIRNGGHDESDFYDSYIHVPVRDAAYFGAAARRAAFEGETRQTVAVLYLAGRCDTAFPSLRTGGKSDGAGAPGGGTGDCTDGEGGAADGAE